MSRTEELFTRSKPSTHFHGNAHVETETLHVHPIARKRKLKTNHRNAEREYIAKSDLKASVSIIELYAASVFRLFVANGNRIPKYTKIEGHNSLASEEIKGITTFYDLADEFLPRLKLKRYQLDAEHPESYGNIIADKILANPKFNNLRVFAQILVCSIAFSEIDLKDEHIVFDEKGRLTRLDFDLCFSGAKYIKTKSRLIDLDYEYTDFENLPLVQHFHPHNFIFNYGGSQKEHPWQIANGMQLGRRLGPQFQQEIYEAILKILIMPDLLLGSMGEIISSRDEDTQQRISTQMDNETVFQKRDRLLTKMKKSPGFNQFLLNHGTEAKDRILKELVTLKKENPTEASGGYLYHNSYFRKKYHNAPEFKLRCERELNIKLNKLVSDASVSQKLIDFLDTQIDHLENCKFTRGVNDKKSLFTNIRNDLQTLSGLETNKDEILRGVYADISMVAHHRRSRSSHGLFGMSSSQSWNKWTEFCKENHIEIEGLNKNRPVILIDDNLVSSYNEYRRNCLNK